MARSLNQYQAKNQLIAAALIGAVVMVMADWIGRTLCSHGSSLQACWPRF
ncbi:hypothetical protein N779_09245 [Vibrio coralliilyticus OCN008]|nr:hypothetical protein N779_09245 [Vibrio coralliilyticus OCN008]